MPARYNLIVDGALVFRHINPALVEAEWDKVRQAPGWRGKAVSITRNGEPLIAKGKGLSTAEDRVSKQAADVAALRLRERQASLDR